MERFSLLSLLLLASCASAEQAPPACEPLPPDITLQSSALTMEQVEQASLAKMAQYPQAPQVPFGHANGKWQVLSGKLQPTDVLYEISSANRWGGYAAMRGKCVIGYMHTWVL